MNTTLESLSNAVPMVAIPITNDQPQLVLPGRVREKLFLSNRRAKAALTITHAGMNTTLESLSYGVPMVAIPNYTLKRSARSSSSYCLDGKLVRQQKTQAI